MNATYDMVPDGKSRSEYPLPSRERVAAQPPGEGAVDTRMGSQRKKHTPCAASRRWQVLRLGLALLSGVMLSVGVAASLAQTLEAPALRRKQEAQQRAKDLTRELVSSILDIQLKQLSENGLDEMPVYRDVLAMRNNIDGLVEAEMQEVVEILLKAQHAEKADREELFVSARGKIREVVVRLAIERQNLLRRLKVAELGVQIKRLIGLQVAARDKTAALPELPRQQQAEAAVVAVEDQRDVKSQFLQLVGSLSEVRDWGGEIGAGAADGLRILKIARVGQELDEAGTSLAAAEFAVTVEHQQAVLRGLQLLLAKVEETQGLIGADREGLLEQVRELARRQEAVRQKTRQSDLNDADQATRLADDQSAIRRDLGRLTDGLGKSPAAQPMLEQALTASDRARTELFDAHAAEAVSEQTKVLGSLAEIEQQLEKAGDPVAGNRSAEQYAQLVKNLQEARQTAQASRQQQLEAAAIAKKEPTKARAQEQRAAGELKSLADEKELPAAVESRLQEAAEKAQTAAEALADASESAAPHREKAAESAAAAVDAALAEIETALADAQRKALAVKLGELARAAEALERAAAAEREIAMQAERAAHEGGLSPEAAAELATEQQEVGKIAEKLAAGVQPLAPQAAETLESAAADTRSAGEQLAAAAQAEEPASAVAEEANMHAAAAAERMETAADQLREEMGQTAQELASLAREQLAAVEPIRAAVEEAVEARAEKAAPPMAALEQAEAKVRQAEAEQHRAAGRPQAAEAPELAEQIRQALAQQTTADMAAEELSAGRKNAPLEAVSAQQQVVEQAEAAARSAAEHSPAPEPGEGEPNPLVAALEQASAAAEEAARQVMDEHPAEAQLAREQARAALEQAAEMAAEAAQKAAAQPAGEPDAAAQQRVAAAANEARELAAEAAPHAGETLAEAAQEAREAAEELAAGDPAAAAESQEHAAEALSAAAEQLAQAREDMAAKSAEQMQQQAAEAGQLSEQAAAVDAPAAAALHAAQEAAQAAAEQPANHPPAAENATNIDRAWERALANLTAREDRLRRDEAVAEAIARSVAQQREAVEQIGLQRDNLEQMADNAADGAKPAGDAPHNGADSEENHPGQQGESAESSQHAKEAGTAAEALAEAADNFAAAQRTAGQGAEEVAGQQEIANRPIREALELASQLGDQHVPESTDNAAESSDSAATQQPGETAEDSSAATESPHESGTDSAESSKATPLRGGKPRGSGKAGIKPHGSSPHKGAADHASSQHPSAGQESSSDSQHQMGTRFSPKSPEATAQMMAGSQAQSQLAAAQAGRRAQQKAKAEESGQHGHKAGHESASSGKSGQEKPGSSESASSKSSKDSEDGQGQASNSKQSSSKSSSSKSAKAGKASKPGATSSGGQGGSSRDGQEHENAALQEGPLVRSPGAPDGNDSRTADDVHSAKIRERAAREDPWFARLPPDLRQAIRANSQRRAPKGYEDRLQRYFENID